MTRTAFRRVGAEPDIEIEHDGARCPARRGESVAAALLASGRGTAVCAVGQCFQCVATVDGIANRRTCRVAAAPGMRVESAAREFAARARPARVPIPCGDVVVVGAGPAGAALSLALAAEGVRVTLLDDCDAPGGQVWRRPAAGDAADARDGGAWLRARIAAVALVDHRAGVETVDLRDGREVWALDGDGYGHILRPRIVAVATGAIERNVALPGWELPGVLNLGGLQALAKAQGLVPAGLPALLAGTGPLLYLVADELCRAGVRLAAVVDAAPFPPPAAIGALLGAPGLARRALGFEWRLRRARVPILRGHAIARIDGDMAEKRVEVRPLGRDGAARFFAAGAVGLGFGLRPNVDLVQVAGAELGFDAALGGWHARVDGGCETSMPGLYAIGETCGVRGVEAALCDATIAAAAIVERLGRAVSPELATAVRAARERRARFVRAARALGGWARVPEGLADAETTVCRCERVLQRDLDAAAALDLKSPAAVKMATRIGMGLCQGRACAANATRAAEGPPRARFPIRPCPADAFAPDLTAAEPDG